MLKITGDWSDGKAGVRLTNVGKGQIAVESVYFEDCVNGCQARADDSKFPHLRPGESIREICPPMFLFRDGRFKIRVEIRVLAEDRSLYSPVDEIRPTFIVSERDGVVELMEATLPCIVSNEPLAEQPSQQHPSAGQ